MPYARVPTGAAFGWRVYDLSWLFSCVPLHSTVQPTSHVKKGPPQGSPEREWKLGQRRQVAYPRFITSHKGHHPQAQSIHSTFPAKRTLPAERPNPRTACSAPARLSLPARDGRSTANTAATLHCTAVPLLFFAWVALSKSPLLSFPHFPCDRAWRTHQECSNLKYQSDGPSPPIATSRSPTLILAPALPLQASSQCRSNNSNNHHHHRPCISASHNIMATTAVHPP